MVSIKYVKAENLLNGFSDKQIEELMKNMTIFMPMDGCPSPCDICALEASKRVEYVMDFSLIRQLYTDFVEAFNKNQPGEHANDQFAYHGKEGEDFSDVLSLHRDLLTYYPRVFTAFPKGSRSVLEKILNMGFVSVNHPAENSDTQLVVPKISRVPTNKHLVDKYIWELENSGEVVRKSEDERDLDMVKSLSYFIKTSRGERELVVRTIPIFPIGTGKKYVNHPDAVKGGFYHVTYNQGVAVLPSGFYEYIGGRDCTYLGILKRRITPENFSFKEMKERTTYICRDAKTSEILCIPMGKSN